MWSIRRFAPIVCIWFGLVGLASDACLAQSQDSTVPYTPVQPVSHQVLCYLFIDSVGYQDNKKREAQDAGRDASKIGDDYRPILRTSDDDVEQMLRITVAGYHSIKEKEKDERTAVLAYKAQYGAKERAHMPAPENIKQLEQDRWKLVDQTMDELKDALGEETYGRLDKWIIATWGSRPRS